MKIEVTQKDIDRGWQTNPQYCPVALAWTGREKPKRLPIRVTRFIPDFDGGRHVEPFSFSFTP